MSSAKIKRTNVAIFELDTDQLKPYPSRTNEFKHLPLFPLVEKDLSIIVDENVKWEEIESTISKMVKELEFIEKEKDHQNQRYEPTEYIGQGISSKPVIIRNKQLRDNSQRISCQSESGMPVLFCFSDNQITENGKPKNCRQGNRCNTT